MSEITKTPAQLIDAVLEAACALPNSLMLRDGNTFDRLYEAIGSYAAAGSPKAKDLVADGRTSAQLLLGAADATIARLAAELADARKNEAANLKAEIAAETALIAARAELKEFRALRLAMEAERSVLLGAQALAEKRRALLSCPDDPTHWEILSKRHEDGAVYRACLQCHAGHRIEAIDAALDGGKE